MWLYHIIIRYLKIIWQSSITWTEFEFYNIDKNNELQIIPSIAPVSWNIIREWSCTCFFFLITSQLNTSRVNEKIAVVRTDSWQLPPRPKFLSVKMSSKIRGCNRTRTNFCFKTRHPTYGKERNTIENNIQTRYRMKYYQQRVYRRVLCILLPLQSLIYKQNGVTELVVNGIVHSTYIFDLIVV